MELNITDGSNDAAHRVNLLRMQVHAAEREREDTNDPPVVRWFESLKEELEQAEQELARLSK